MKPSVGRIPTPDAPISPPQDVAGQDMCAIAAPRLDPAHEEANKLREEAMRALHRLLAHEAMHNQWRVVRTAKAIEALRNY